MVQRKRQQQQVDEILASDSERALAALDSYLGRIG